MIAPGVQQQPTYCDRISALRDQLVIVGAQLIDFDAFSDAVYNDLANAFYDFSAELTATLNAWAQGFKNSNLSTYLKAGWTGYLISFGFETRPGIRELTAVKNFLEMLGSWRQKSTSGMESSTENSSQADIGFHIPIIGGIGTEGRSHKIGNSRIEESAEIKGLLLPALKLLDQCINLTIQQEPPSTAEAVDMFLNNVITVDHCRCLVEANGGIWSEWDRAIVAKRERPDARTLIDAYYRDFMSRPELIASLRDNGWLNEDEASLQVEMAKEYPTPTDIVHFMVRNVFDENLVQRFHLDDEFEQKWAGSLQDWTRYAKVPEEVIRAHWRSHWIVPSPTLLYEMLQRLRPDKPEFQNTNLPVTIADVNAALGENDWAPFWRPKLLEISYKVINRIDLRRLYAAGSIDDKEFVSRQQDQGYKKADAELMLDWQLRQKKSAFKKSQIVKDAVIGLANTDQVHDAASDAGFTDQEITDLLDDVVKQRQRNVKKNCIANIKKRFEVDEWNETQTEDELVDVGVERGIANDLVSGWKCKKGSRVKQIAARELCDWYDGGLITVDDFQARLIKLGYSENDATTIVHRCLMKIDERAERLALAEQRRLQREMDAEARRREQEARRAAQAADKQRREQVRILQKEENLRKQWEGIALKIGDLNKTQPDDTTQQLIQLWREAQLVFHATASQATEAVQVLDKIPTKAFPITLRDEYLKALAGILALGQLVPSPGNGLISPPPSLP